MPKGQTERRTDGRKTVTLRFPVDAASVINNKEEKQKSD